MLGSAREAAQRTPTYHRDARCRQYHPRGNAHDLLHHRLDPPPLGGMAHRTIRADQSCLADGTQNIVSPHGQRQRAMASSKVSRMPSRHEVHAVVAWAG